MSDQNKYLLLARRAREENNAEDAKKYYDLVRTDDPENAEARFFYAYYRLMNGKQGEAYSQFVNLCNVLIPTLEMIAVANDNEADKRALLKDIVACMETSQSVTSNAIKNINGTNSFMSEFNLAIQYSDTMINFGDKIKELFENKKDFLEIAVFVWKSVIISVSKEKFILTAMAGTNRNPIEECRDKIAGVSPEYAEQIAIIREREANEAKKLQIEKAEKEKIEKVKKCYKSFLVLINLAEAKNNAELKFHVNQGLWLLIIEIASLLVCGIPFVGGYLFLALLIVAIIFSVKGVKAVDKEDQFEIPFLGKIKLIK